MSEVQQPKSDIERMLDAIDLLSLAAKGVRYIKNEFPETKQYDHDQLFQYISRMMGDSSKVNALVMSADPVALSSIKYFVHWYATSIDSALLPSMLSRLGQVRIDMLALTSDI